MPKCVQSRITLGDLQHPQHGLESVAPARFTLFPTVSFLSLRSLCPSSRRNCSHHGVMKQEMKKVEDVILTFFTLSPQVPVRQGQLDGAIQSRNARRQRDWPRQTPGG